MQGQTRRRRTADSAAEIAAAPVLGGVIVSDAPPALFFSPWNELDEEEWAGAEDKGEHFFRDGSVNNWFQDLLSLSANLT